MSDRRFAADERDPHSDAFAAAFGSYLVAHGYADAAAVARAQRAQRQSGERFDIVVVRLGLVTEQALAAALAGWLGLPFIAGRDLPAHAVLANRIGARFARTNRVLPLGETDGRLRIAVADPLDEGPLEAIAFLLERAVERVVAVPSEIEKAVERAYSDVRAATAETGPAAAADPSGSDDDVRRLEDMASEAPVIRYVHQLIARAVELAASDIHIEPAEDCLRVRLRIDGALQAAETQPLAMRAPVTSRLKIMASLNIAERRLPQDGRIRENVRGREIDLRVSTMPTLHGESVVLRILDRSAVRLDLAALGFSPALESGLRRAIEAPHGIVLVTGPTGSGKTTTLYSALSQLNRAESKILTVEDPVEYHLAGINQIQVQPRIGLTFANALRSILRQDPDIIMIGEIRDRETAEIAIQASLTGHLVLSTVHANSAAATIARLLDMGVEDYLIASSLTAVLAQRLVRRLCGSCAEPVEPPPVFLARLAREGHIAADSACVPAMRRRIGCNNCRNTGYSGRTTIAELLPVDGPVHDRILVSGTERAIAEAAAATGMRTLLQDGLGKVLAGETSYEEVVRAIRMG